MCEARRGRFRLAGALALGLVSGLGLSPSPAAAEPAVRILDLPFRARALRGPGSEIAVAVATSGLLPIARPKDPVAEGAPIAVVWGEDGGAALSLAGGVVKATLLGAEAIEGFAAAETPRGALPGSRRAVAGPVTAYLSGPTRALGGEGAANAAALTIRERQAVAFSADPKPVPVETATVRPGAQAVFAPLAPRALDLDGRPAFAAVTRSAAGSGPALVGRAAAGAPWSLLAAGAPGAGPFRISAIADFAGTGRPQLAAFRAADTGGSLQLWGYADGALSLLREAPGYADGPDDTDLASPLAPARDGPAELVLPSADRAAVAVLSLRDGFRERLRVALPAPAGFGLAVLGRGEAARILVGLSDGRVVDIALDGTKAAP
ncbi:hypothetical protein [Methylobacterium sp. A54F]